MTTSAKRIARSVSAVASFSAVSVTLALRLSPAVSIRLSLRPRHSKSMAMASLVRPGSGPVSMRSSPSSALTRVDLPVFGRPTMATRIGLAAVASPSSPSSATRRASSSSRPRARMISATSSPVPSPCSAEIAMGSPRPSSNAS